MSLTRLTLRDGADLDGFRRAARALIAAELAPQHVVFTTDAAPDLLGEESLPDGSPLRLPRAVAELIELGVCHSNPERYALLYALVWRVLNGERELTEVASDPLVHRLQMMAKSVRRDLHKMHAFLRFRRVEAEGPERFVAWFEPEHHILEKACEFFVDRFRSMRWTILTPRGSAQWDGATLSLGPPGLKMDAPEGDSFEEGWRDYYRSIFNPARLNPTAMRAEMPKKYWRNLPEAQAIPELIRQAPERVEAMIAKEVAMPRKRNPDAAVAAMQDAAPKTLEELNRVIQASEPLVPGATQAVLGEGPVGAAVAFVGEQPGDQEDLLGRPFVGPAGQLLSRAMAEVGLDRKGSYLTNAVKHFKFEQRGKRRIHQKPTAGEVKHYRWWLMRELELVRPQLVVALGATAVLALTGKSLPIIRARGEADFGPDYRGYITVHPSYLLRLPDEESKAKGYEEFLADLARIRDLAARPAPQASLRLAAE